MEAGTLTFTDPGIEEHYLRYATQGRTSTVDVFYWRWAFAVRMIFWAKHAASLSRGATGGGHMYLAWLIVEAVLRRRLERAGSLWRWREHLVALNRVLHTLEFGFGASDLLSSFIADMDEDDPVATTITYILSQGFLTMLFLGLFQPLRFRLHLPLQLFSAIFLLFTLGLEAIRQTGAKGIPGTEWMFLDLDELAKRTVGIMMGIEVHGGIPTSPVEYPSLQMDWFLTVYIGFGLISYVVWLLERRSRVAFFKALPVELKLGRVPDPLGLSAIVLHVVLFVAAFGVLWINFAAIAPSIVRLGLCGAKDCSQWTPQTCAALDLS
eukprot:evm.model.scf_64.1 EVM.evm.TU.scf_64.1   scf_64:1123-2736(+)